MNSTSLNDLSNSPQIISSENKLPLSPALTVRSDDKLARIRNIEKMSRTAVSVMNELAVTLSLSVYPIMGLLGCAALLILPTLIFLPKAVFIPMIIGVGAVFLSPLSLIPIAIVISALSIPFFLIHCATRSTLNPRTLQFDSLEELNRNLPLLQEGGIYEELIPAIAEKHSQSKEILLILDQEIAESELQRADSQKKKKFKLDEIEEKTKIDLEKLKQSCIEKTINSIEFSNKEKSLFENKSTSIQQINLEFDKKDNEFKSAIEEKQKEKRNLPQKLLKEIRNLYDSLVEADYENYHREMLEQGKTPVALEIFKRVRDAKFLNPCALDWEFHEAKTRLQIVHDSLID